MVQELVKVAFPEDSKGCYPSDCAWKRDEDGNLQPRGRTAYGDGILEHLSDNNFKVLSDAEIIRMPRNRVAKVAATVEPPAAPVVAQEAVAATPARKSKSKKSKKKASKAA
jgi:hypothetical protein